MFLFGKLILYYRLHNRLWKIVKISNNLYLRFRIRKLRKTFSQIPNMNFSFQWNFSSLFRTVEDNTVSYADSKSVFGTQNHEESSIWYGPYDMVYLFVGPYGSFDTNCFSSYDIIFESAYNTNVESWKWIRKCRF